MSNEPEWMRYHRGYCRGCQECRYYIPPEEATSLITYAEDEYDPNPKIIPYVDEDEALPAFSLMEKFRMGQNWPTPDSMRRAADGLDILSIPRWGDILRWVADLCDAEQVSPDQTIRDDILRRLGLLRTWKDGRELVVLEDVKTVVRRAFEQDRIKGNNSQPTAEEWLGEW